MKTPILFLIYNRPEYTKKVFEVIKKAKPEKLFVYADGPKQGKQADIEMCDDTRRIIQDIDWPCEIQTNFSDSNLGCRLGVTRGINWFFDNVEQGIILEDDCLPSESFFVYCEKLLDKYKDNERVMMVSGSNPATSVDVETDYSRSVRRHFCSWSRKRFFHL
jgi:hypothetical protein